MRAIPEKCLQNHLAILGKAGSGKTVTAKGIAEGLLEAGQRLCAIDLRGFGGALNPVKTGRKRLILW